MIGAQQIEWFFKTAGGRRVLVVGDLILDHYVRGEASRISPEAPVQIVRTGSEELRLGGAGNVACNLLELGGEVRFGSIVGEDEDGRLLQQSLERLGIEAILHFEPGRVTSRKTRIMAGGQQVLRLDRESSDPPERSVGQRFARSLAESIEWAEAVFLSDYGKGALSAAVLDVLLPAAAGRLVFVDPKGRDYRRYRGATLLKPNHREAELAAGIDIDDEKSLEEAGARLLEQSEAERLLLTRGGEGMSLFEPGLRLRSVPARVRDVFDVTGAGDTVLAFAGMGLLCGLSFVEAAELASLAAAVVVQKVGAATVRRVELERELGLPWPHRKEVGWEEAAAVLRLARRQGRTVVFTNGCFDLLHIGHVHVLREARKLGDLLVVGMNTDRSIREIKGERRPLIPQHERAHLLAALDAVDLVVLFDEPTPVQLIEALEPDVLVKGADYTKDQVVGGEIVEAAGGRIELIELQPGRSTSGLIQRVLERYGDGARADGPVEPAGA